MTLQKTHLKALTIFILTGICLLGFVLRVYQLDTREIWGDEAFSIVTGAMPLQNIVAPMVDMHPPLYYALNGGWMYSAGTSVFAMRYGTLLMNLLIIPVAYGLARDFFGRRAGVLLALLCAISPVYIYYAQELRMYSLLVLSTAVSMWFFLRYSHRPSRLNAGVYLLATLMAMYTHYNAFLVIAAQNLIVLITASWHGKRLRWFIGQGILALIYLPWAMTNAEFMLARFSGGGDTGGGLSLNAIGQTAAQNLSSWLTGITAGDATLAFIVSVVGLMMVLIVLLRHPRQQRDVVLTLFIWGAFVLFVMSIMNSTAGYFHPRFAIAGVLPFLLLITYGALLLWRYAPPMAAGAILVLIIGAGIANQNWYTDPAYEKSTYGSSLALIDDNAESGDIIFYHGPYQRGLHFYYASQTVPGTMLDMQRVNNTETYDDYLSEIASDATRIWLVENGDVAFYDPWRFVPAWLTERGFLQRSFSYLGGTVALYVLDDGDTEFTSTDFQFGDAIRLTGYALEPENPAPGDILRLSLQWEATAIPQADYTVGNYILNSAGQLVTQIDAQPGNGSRPTSQWQPDETLIDRFAIPLPSDLAPGEYSLAIGLYPYPDVTRLSVMNANNPADDLAGLLTFTIAP